MDKMTKNFKKSLCLFCRKWWRVLLFTAFFLWLFPRSSGLRPIVYSSPLKEPTVGLWVLLFLYLHYLFLIPCYLGKKRYTLYTVIFIVTLLLCGAGEILFLCDDLREFIYYGYSLEEQHYFLFQDFLFVTMRDAGLLAVFVLLKQLEIVNDEYTDLQNEGIRRFRVVKVRDKDNKPLLLSMDDILYCEQKKNYTHFHTATGEYTALTSLKTISLQFGKECVQISRNTLVMQHAIEQEGDTFLILKESAYPDNLKELMVNERYRKENRRIPRS